ncbi:hypothetical protein PTKIN_Ptkin07bG0004900 [Pterospermum kingtungense]
MALEVDREKASFMLQAKTLGFPVSNTSKRSFFIAQIMLRAFAAGLTLVAVCVMATSSQSVTVLGITIKAQYSDSSATRFLLVSDAIVCAFSVISVISVYCLSRSESNPRNSYLFLHDMVIMVLAISGCAAATAVGYISRYGEEKMGWFAVCDRVGKFCTQMTISLVLSYLAFFCYFALAVMSSNKQSLVSSQ